MQYKSAKGFSGMGMLGILFICFGAGLILTVIIQTIIGFQIVPPGTPFEKMGDAMPAALKDPQNLAWARLMQVSGTFTLLFIPAVVFTLICNGKQSIWLGFSKHISVFQVLIGFLIIFTATVCIAPIDEWVRRLIAHFPSINIAAGKLEEVYNEQVLNMSNMHNWTEFIIALIVIAFFPALFEEVFFRGALQNILIRWWQKPVIAILVTSILFSLVHSSIYLFVGRAFLGFVLGWMYYKTKNIWTNIIAHFLNNALALAQLFSLQLQQKKISIQDADVKVEWWVGLIAIGVIVFLFRLLKRYSSRNYMKIQTKEQLLLSANADRNLVR